MDMFWNGFRKESGIFDLVEHDTNDKIPGPPRPYAPRALSERVHATFQPKALGKPNLSIKPFKTVSRTLSLTKHAKDAEIARVALMDTVNNTLLMGRRKDNKRWTLTSGHLEKGEKPIDAAVREVKEESGITITPDMLKSIGVNKFKKEDGSPVKVHGFYVPFAGQTPSAQHGNDPDDEMSTWRWESLRGGLPKDIGDNLHIPLEKDKVVQFALQKLQDQAIEKAAGVRKHLIHRAREGIDFTHQLSGKFLSEAPQQYAQNFDKIEAYRKKEKQRKIM
jgi:8-oxo-dGTP pyrophosphatase MutT (NUDIX family)